MDFDEFNLELKKEIKDLKISQNPKHLVSNYKHDGKDFKIYKLCFSDNVCFSSTCRLRLLEDIKKYLEEEKELNRLLKDFRKGKGIL